MIIITIKMHRKKELLAGGIRHTCIVTIFSLTNLINILVSGFVKTIRLFILILKSLLKVIKMFTDARQYNGFILSLLDINWAGNQKKLHNA